MTTNELLSQVDEYFTSHLMSTTWQALDDSTRLSATTMAFRDMQGRVTRLTLDNISGIDLAIYAVAEQAIYLISTLDETMTGKVTTSESLDVFSNSFAVIGSDFSLSPRAVSFVTEIEKLLNPAFVQLRRG